MTDLRNICPPYPAHDLVNRVPRNAKCGSDVPGSFAIGRPGANRDNVEWGNLRGLPMFHASLPRAVEHVIGVRAGEQMIGSYAPRIIASVTNLCSSRYVAVVQHPRDPVSSVVTTSDAYLPISAARHRAGPLPATVTLSDLCPEATG